MHADGKIEKKPQFDDESVQSKNINILSKSQVKKFRKLRKMNLLDNFFR